MSKSTTIDYELLIQNSVRNGIRDLLKGVSVNGLPGEHYFYIDFLTDFPGVQISEELKKSYPNDMMISIQYDFFDLAVDQDSFSVTLVFDEDEERIRIPFASILRFADPSVDFGFDFAPDFERFNSSEILDIIADIDEDTRKLPESDQDKNNVVFLDLFKKK